MKGFKVFTTLTMVIVLGVLVQSLLFMAENQDSPRKAALEFSEAYFGVDWSMEDRICNERLVVSGVDVVDEYIEGAEADARARGFELSCFVRERLYNVGTTIVSQDKDSATVRINGRAKSPVRAFFTGESKPVDAEISVVREDGQWRVCGALFELPLG